MDQPISEAQEEGAAGAGARAFLSYSHKDHRLGERLRRALDGFQDPEGGKRVEAVSRARAEVMAGGELGDRLKSILGTADTLVVLCTPRSASSRWVNQEIAAFKLMGKSARIVPVIADGPDAQAMPLTLRFDVDADGGPTDAPDTVERTQVDLRRGGDGFAAGRLKILAAVTGASLEAVEAADRSAGVRRLIIGLVAAAVVAVAALVLLGG